MSNLGQGQKLVFLGKYFVAMCMVEQPGLFNSAKVADISDRGLKFKPGTDLIAAQKQRSYR
ncbi:hypothetical protein [Tychonema sp. LEGE 07203]|uniref:hypothetical protein n=1 Tax=Tychonema sp. LEGE 07203 TaxID=1828671 RepID=UPI001A089C96|nr:hypothetical protein [Tychonema sp. LEGE 07203]MBE9094103.1 hypothetical protein [Tychonema sp. LEGE 07203]